MNLQLTANLNYAILRFKFERKDVIDVAIGCRPTGYTEATTVAAHFKFSIKPYQRAISMNIVVNLAVLLILVELLVVVVDNQWAVAVGERV